MNDIITQSGHNLQIQNARNLRTQIKYIGVICCKKNMKIILTFATSKSYVVCYHFFFLGKLSFIIVYDATI